LFETAATKMFDETKQFFYQHAFCPYKIEIALKIIAE
jgi:hypothetical protein